MKSILVLFLSFLLLLPCHAQTEVAKSNSNYGITFSFPWVNYYNYVDYHLNQSRRTFGFFGVGLSGYYKKGINKISFNVSTTEDLSSPIAAVSYSKNEIHTSIGCTYFELIHHHSLNQSVNIIGGLNLTNYAFHLESTIDSVPSYKINSQTLGFSLGLEYRFNNYYSVAAIYRPAFASFETDGKYRHLINIDLRIDLDFRKRK